MHLAKRSIARTGLFGALALTFGLLCAQPSGAPQAEGQQQHRKPPQEAFDACKALKSGQDCNFTSPHGAETGTCFAPEGKPLACRPKHPPKEGTKDAPAGAPPAPKK